MTKRPIAWQRFVPAHPSSTASPSNEMLANPPLLRNFGQADESASPPKQTRHMSLAKISVNYFRVSFSEYFEQDVTIAQRVNGVLLISPFDGIFQPGGDARICKYLLESHTQVLAVGNMTFWSWSLGDRSGINLARSEIKRPSDLSETNKGSGTSQFLLAPKREKYRNFIILPLEIPLGLPAVNRTNVLSSVVF